MAKQTKINTPALYVNTDRGVALLNLKCQFKLEKR